MKKVILENREEQTYLSDLNNNSHVGFVDSDNDKGHIVYIGGTGDNDKFSAISVSNLGVYCNFGYDCKPSLLEALEIDERYDAKIVELFVFETRKELYRWLSED